MTLLAKEANRYKILNGNNPQQSKLPRGDRDSMEEFINNIRILIGAMSHKVLEPIYKQTIESATIAEENDNIANSNIELFLNVNKIDAKAVLTDEGIVVKNGSEVFLKERESLGLTYKNLRKKLQDEGVLSLNNDKLIFTQNFLFPSPSQAAAVIVGYSINGRNSWTLSSGMTLKEYEEEQLSEVDRAGV